MRNEVPHRPGKAIQAVRQVPRRLVGHQLLVGVASVAELHDQRGADMIPGAGLSAGADYRGNGPRPRKILANSMGTTAGTLPSPSRALGLGAWADRAGHADWRATSEI